MDKKSVIVDLKFQSARVLCYSFIFCLSLVHVAVLFSALDGLGGSVLWCGVFL